MSLLALQEGVGRGDLRETFVDAHDPVFYAAREVIMCIHETAEAKVR
jgi:hypothetical protein